MALEVRDKPLERLNFFRAYRDNAAEYLKGIHPEVDPAVIEKFITDKINGRINELNSNERSVREKGELYKLNNPVKYDLPPTLHVVFNSCNNDPGLTHSYGNYTERDNFGLYELSSKFRNKIIAPSGTFYQTSNIHKSFIATMVNNKKKARSAEKKLMLAAKNCDDKVGETFHNKKQATIKIMMNSLPGAFGSGFNLYSSVPNYNAITSIARFCIQNAYAHAERLLESNFYFRTPEQAINFMVSCKLHGPKEEDTLRVVAKYHLHQPTADEVYNFITGCLSRYTFDDDFPTIRKYINNCTDGHLAFMFYMSNMRHIVFTNEAVFRPWIDELLAHSDKVLAGKDVEHVDPNLIYKLDGDLVIMLSTVHNHLMPTNPKSGNTITPYETLSPDYNRPDVTKKLVVLGQHMEAKLAEIQELFDHFTCHSVGIGYVAEHKNMFRDCTILSDTDSIIFTTKSWAKWYQGNLKLDDTAYNINALAVYWLSKANAYILYHLSTILGATGKDMFILNMKNEFMMPIEILTSLKKHYVSILKIQEGVFYNTPKLDIKGVGFRGSNLCRESLNYSEWMIREVLDDISKDLCISANKYIDLVMKFESFIYHDIRSGHSRFLPVAPVRDKSEYKTESNIYFNYTLWEEVFGEEYGHIILPTKCFVLPLNGLTSSNYRSDLAVLNPRIAEKLDAFLAAHPKKDITRIPVNPQVALTPVELRDAIDYRTVIYTNCKPLYLLLQTFGISTGTKSDAKSLFSDMYPGWVDATVAKEAVEPHI